MIYLVTGQRALFESNNTYKCVSVAESLKLLKPLKVVGLDTETTGIDCHNDTLISLQLGCFDFQVVIDCLTTDITAYKDYIESDRLFLFWNARFDLKWLFRFHIVPKRVYDGFLAEKLMWLGYPIVLTVDVWNKIKCPRYDYIPAENNGKKKTNPYYMLRMTLKKAGEMYCNIELDKTIRGRIIYEGFSPAVIEYAALDVKYLEKIKEAQEIELRKKGLLTALDYENRFILPLAYMEFCGVRINVEKWKKKMSQDQKNLEDVRQQLDKWLIENEPESKYVFVDMQGDLFNGFDMTPKVSINWKSSKQVIPIFKKYGVDVETEEGTDSIEAKKLAPQKDKCSLIPLYIRYKELEKLTSTYGQNFLDQIDRKTGRIYTNFSPMGTDTARISSGGKDKANKVKYINFLNIPSDSFTRSCFVAEPGYKWISIDYAGQESFIMADQANDKAMIHELMEGSKDLHSLTAKMVFTEIPRDFPVERIKKEYHKLRGEAKGYEFAFNYAGNAFTIMQNFGLSEQRANEIYNNYMKGFNGLKQYQDKRKRDWWEKGYIDLNPTVGYKAYIYDYEYLKKLKDSFNEPGFWDHYRDMKKIDPNSYTVQKVKEFFKRKADSDRQSVNYPIQHTGALCYKVSMVNFFEYLRQNNLLFKVLITITPYDEINCEAPADIAETIAGTLHGIMVKAGAYFVKRVRLDADLSRHKICIKDYEINGKRIMSKGDVIASMDEDSIVNLNTGESFKIKNLDKGYKECLDDNGPLPEYWVH